MRRRSSARDSADLVLRCFSVAASNVDKEEATEVFLLDSVLLVSVDCPLFDVGVEASE